MGRFEGRVGRRPTQTPGKGAAPAGVLARLAGHRALIGYDLAIAALFGLLGVVPEALDSGPPPGYVVAAATVVAVPIAVRRVWPVPAFAAGLVVGTAIVFAPTSMAAGPFLVAMTLYTVALTRSRRFAWIALLLALAATGFGLGLRIARTPPDPIRPDGWPDPYYVIGSIWLVLAAVWTMGRGVRERRVYAARAADQVAARAVTEERLRIAREMHDVVGHSMGLIAVKAAVAAHVAQQRPEEAQDALRIIETTSRGSLAEIRRLLGVLRVPPGTGPLDNAAPGPATPDPAARDLAAPTTLDSAAELAPVPGLDRLPELAETARAAGVRVDLNVCGETPAGVGTSVYRIVQESLTNVIKHAAPAYCRVDVTAGEGRVRIEVTDDGPGPGPLPGTGGHGLIGMRERVAMYGGTFTAGPGREGGFRVSASWELP